MNILFYILPHFVNRYYLRLNIGRMAEKYKFLDNLIDIGSGEKPYRELFKYTINYLGIDFKDFSRNKGYTLSNKPDFYFKKSYLQNFKLPFKNNSFANVVSFQVLEHHPHPEKLIREVARIIKKNGLVMMTIPFIWSLHEKPADYYRFTPYILERMFAKAELELVEIKRVGSFFSVICSLAIDFLIEFMKKNIFFYIFGIILYPFFIIFSILSLILDTFLQSEDIYLNTLIVARKI